MREHTLRRDEGMRLRGNAAGRSVSCREGILWVTQTGNPGDHLLRAGETFSSERPGRLVVGALADSIFTVADVRSAPAPSSGMLPQVLRRLIRRAVAARRRLWA